MPIPLIRTKLNQPPVAKDHLHRQHLLDRLDMRRHRPLTLVSAPAGYGKSTLLSCWLESCPCARGWVSLDANDSDLRTFMAYFLGAIDTMFPGSVGETQGTLKGTDLPPLDILTANLINEVDAIGEDFILVLDDYHTIRDTAVHDLVQRLLIHPPRNMHLAVATRRDPSFPIVELRARGQVTEIRVQDLRFSPTEVASFLNEVMQVDVDDHIAAVIEAKTEGWVVGLRLAVLSMRHRSDLQRIIAALPDDNRYVMDYIISEVISQQPVDIRDYLLSTAILDRFCASLCESVCISDNASRTCTLSGSAFIDHIQQNNMFCVPLDDEQKWFRFHHLFRQLLQRQLKRRFGEQAIADLHDRAGEWYARHDCPDEALQHLLSAKNIIAARQLVVNQRYDLTAHEQWHRLERWFEKLPKETVGKDSALLIIQAWIHENRERQPEMVQTLDRIETLLSGTAEAETEHQEILGEYNALRASHFYMHGDIKRARHHADHAIRQIHHNRLSEHAYALLVWAFIHQMDGDATEARKVIFGAMRADETKGSTYTARLLLTLCFIDWLEGDLSGLEQNAGQLLALSRERDLLESMTFANYHLGVSSYYLGRPKKALTYLDLATKSGRLIDPNTYIHGNCLRALSLQAMGQPNDARVIVQEMIDYALQSKNTALLQMIKAFGAELALRQGRQNEALSWAREYAFDPLKQAVRFFVPQLTQVKTLLTMGSSADRIQAGDMLERMHRFFAARHNQHCLIEVLALKAICHDRQGDSTAAMKVLTSALGLAYRSRRMEPFLSLGDQMAILLRQLTGQGRFDGYIAEILAAFETTVAPAGFDDAHSAPPPKQPNEKRRPLGDNPLTNREIDIVQLLNRRLSNKEIAAKLFISPDTVKRHTINIYKKLAARNRQEAVAKAQSLGLI